MGENSPVKRFITSTFLAEFHAIAAYDFIAWYVVEHIVHAFLPNLSDQDGKWCSICKALGSKFRVPGSILPMIL